MAIHFFTDYNEIQNQSSSDAFGPKADVGNNKIFRLDNLFELTPDAKLYAPFTSLFFMTESATDANLLNIALLPFYRISKSLFPINMVIFRGIRKDSIVDGNNLIKTADTSWNTDNVLDVIKKAQDKKNDFTGLDEVAGLESIGLQFNDTNTSIESIVFDSTNDFSPKKVNSGCELGRIWGDDKKFSVEIILDVIGQKVTLDYLKNSNTLFSSPIQNLVGLTPFELAKKKFISRNERSRVIGNIDVTAFYGCHINNNIKVRNLDYGDFNLSKFFNNEVIYLDIRNKYGKSYNNFLDIDDNIKIGQEINEEIILNDFDYYDDGWPVLMLRNFSDANQSETLLLQLPEAYDAVTENLILSNLTDNINFYKGAKGREFYALNKRNKNGQRITASQQLIELKNNSDSGIFKSGYYLVKIDEVNTSIGDGLSAVYKEFFNLSMKDVFNTAVIEDGIFNITTYSSINSPTILNGNLSNISTMTTGIVFDKTNVTFFACTENIAESIAEKDEYLNIPFLHSGKYQKGYNPSDFNYSSTDQSIGFMALLNKFNNYSDYKLEKLKVINTDTSFSNQNLIAFARVNDKNVRSRSISDIETISLSYNEYNQIKQFVENFDFTAHGLGNVDFFISFKIITRENYTRYNLYRIEIELIIPELDEDSLTVKLAPTDISTLNNGESFKLNALINK